MWPFSKKADRLGDSGLYQGFTDWHSHILPGVDDGIQTLEDSLNVLKKYEELGVKRVWLTPHIMEECANTPEGLRERFEYLKSNYNGPVELRLGAENMMDSLFEERLKEKNLLPIGENGDHLLVETSYVNPPIAMDDLIQQVLSLGLTPVLAHPERYRYIMDFDEYKTWKDRGVLFQCNIMSLLGKYGETARAKVERLLKEGMINLTGSDLHRYHVLTNVMITERPKDREALAELVRVAHNPAIKM